MRGLTPLERQRLARRVDNAPREYHGGDTVVAQALAELRRVGRLSGVLVPCHRSPTGFRRENYITDLGRLALRVCPVGEP